MKKQLLSLAAFIVGSSTWAADENITLKVTNPMSVSKKSVPVVYKIDAGYNSALVKVGDKEIPCQLDDMNDDGIFDELSFVTDLGKKETKEIQITLSENASQQKYENKTYGYIGIRDRDKSAKTLKHQPINSVTFPPTSSPYNYIFPHGAVMENEMVGFRIYCDTRQAIDYYGHKNLKADIAETGFYPSKAQVAAGSGDDVLYTGSTYGCGALHGWDGKKSVMFDKIRNSTHTVVCSGPIRTVIDITNKAWQPIEGCKPVDIRTRYILYTGHRDVEVQVTFSRNVADIPLSTGIVDIVEGSEEFTDHAGLRGCWGTACAGNNPAVYDTHTVGLGIMVPKSFYKSESRFSDGKEKLPNQAYAQIVGTDGSALNYWFCCTCDMESFGFKNKEEWFAYLKDWKKTLEKPVIIKKL